MKTETSSDVVFGADDSPIVFDAIEAPIHGQLIQPLNRLKKAAQDAGFELKVASGYRSFSRQRTIWDAKASGERTLLDDQGQPLDPAALSEIERIYAILRWSALPGASRHHWGTEIDIYDASSMPDNYKLQLTPEETTAGGVFADFYIWLEGYLADQDAFYRPYSADLGGVAPEPWHLSYAPLAREFASSVTLPRLQDFLVKQDFALKSQVLGELDTIYHRYVVNVVD